MQCPSFRAVCNFTQTRAFAIRNLSSSVVINNSSSPTLPGEDTNPQSPPQSRRVPIADSLGDISISNINPNQRRSGSYKVLPGRTSGRSHAANPPFQKKDGANRSSLAARLAKVRPLPIEGDTNVSSVAPDRVHQSAHTLSPSKLEQIRKREEGRQRLLEKRVVLEERTHRRTGILGEQGRQQRTKEQGGDLSTDKYPHNAAPQQRRPSRPRQNDDMHSPSAVTVSQSTFAKQTPSPHRPQRKNNASSDRRTGQRKDRPRMAPHIVAMRERRRQQELAGTEESAEEHSVNEAEGPSPFLSETVNLNETNFPSLFEDSPPLVEMSPSTPKYTAQLRVQLSVEQAAGDYSRYFPSGLGVQTGDALGPVRYAQLTLSRRRDAALHARNTTLGIVEKFVRPSTNDTLIKI